MNNSSAEYNREYRNRPEQKARQKVRAAAWRAKNPGRWISYCENWRNKDPAHARAIQLFHLARRRSGQLGLPFGLTVEDLETRIRKAECEVTGLPLTLTTGLGRRPWTPSLDRKDNKLGYTLENIRITAYIYNLARNTFSDEDLLKMCRAIVANTGGNP